MLPCVVFILQFRASGAENFLPPPTKLFHSHTGTPIPPYLLFASFSETEYIHNTSVVMSIDLFNTRKILVYFTIPTVLEN